MKSYKDLEIYRIAYDLAVKVHKFSLSLPQYELYEEGSQLRKSSKSIPSCIAEGYGRRRYKAEFIRFLTYAHASCDETIVHLNFIKDIHNVDSFSINTYLKFYEDLGSKINKFVHYVEKEWNTHKKSLAINS